MKKRYLTKNEERKKERKKKEKVESKFKILVEKKELRTK